MKKDGKSDELAAALKGTAKRNAELEQATMALELQNDRLEKVTAGKLKPRSAEEIARARRNGAGDG
jgi:putative sterol carrier protein